MKLLKAIAAYVAYNYIQALAAELVYTIKGKYFR